MYDRPEKVREVLENGLRQLGTDYVDVYFDHIWWDKEEETEALGRLKEEGEARAVGVSTHYLKYVKCFSENGGLDVVQLEYSVLNRKAEESIFPYVQEHGIGAVIRGPLQKGLLTGKFTPQSTFPEADLRHNWPNVPWFKDSLQKVERLHVLEREDQRLGQLTLRFVLSHPAVSPLPFRVVRRQSRPKRTPRLISGDDAQRSGRAVVVHRGSVRAWMDSIALCRCGWDGPFVRFARMAR